MKYILLIRHGEALPPGGHIDDFDRILSPRGRKETSAAAVWAAERCNYHGVKKPEALFTSPARRTRETAEIVAPIWGLNPKQILHPGNLYLPNLEELLETLWEQPEDLSSLVLCSHNPGITVLGNYLYGTIPDALAPAGIILGRFEEESWSEIQRNRGTLLDFRNPPA